MFLSSSPFSSCHFWQQKKKNNCMSSMAKIKDNHRLFMILFSFSRVSFCHWKENVAVLLGFVHRMINGNKNIFVWNNKHHYLVDLPFRFNIFMMNSTMDDEFYDRLMNILMTLTLAVICVLGLIGRSMKFIRKNWTITFSSLRQCHRFTGRFLQTKISK